ncbi:hypothetical protein [Ruegeria sp. HKCCD7255]|uniref:hypothetical protein n=1 Tax=Ruegeria sp. HKCCD7255 TaxID=2683004 RepID=UPI001489C781|nr:hypothetical protein [Ruegeria sp. HKCCD7255]
MRGKWHERLQRFFAISLFVCAAASLRADERPEEQKVLFAAGGKWVAQDISWEKYNGNLRVSLVASLVELKTAPLLHKEALSALCQEVIVNLPSAPEEVADENDYRVALNMRSLLSGDNPNPVFSFPLPIQVRQGNCQIKPDGELYFYSYPATLENWEMTKVLYDVEGSDPRAIALHFRSIDQSTNKPLPFVEACNAFFADPPPALAKLKQLYGLRDNLENFPIRIAEYDNPKTNLSFDAPTDLSLYAYENDDIRIFKLQNNACVPWS